MKSCHVVKVLGTFSIGCIATYLFYSFNENIAIKEAEQRFNSNSITRINEIKKSLQNTQDVLLAFKAFFVSSDDVTENDFNNFASVITTHNSYVSSLSWHEKKLIEKSKLEKTHHQQYPGRYIYFNTDEYNIIPTINNSKLNIFSNNTNQTEFISMNLVEDKNNIFFKKNINDTSNYIKFSLPIYHEDKKNIYGFLVMVIDLNNLIGDALSNLPTKPTSIIINSESKTIATFNASVDDSSFNHDKKNQFKFTDTMIIADGKFEFMSSSKIDDYYNLNHISRIIISLGLLITLFLSYYVYRFVKDFVVITDLVEKKNDDLIHAHKLLSTQEKHLRSNKEKEKALIEIKRGLLNNEMCLYYQPKVNMRTGEVFGAEALIRWIHPTKGVIPPLGFIPIISGTTLESEIGDWVIKQALIQLDEWIEEGINIEISINLTSLHIQKESFITDLSNTLSEHPNVNPSLLQLEIVESSKLGDYKEVGKVISECRDSLGVNVALDDFGTGYSSLTHLRNLHVNVIKIDQTFVRDMLDDPYDFAIVDGVIGLAESFNRSVIAEGVETTAHGLALIITGCEQVQGYGIAKPMPANVFPEWLIRYTPNQEWIDFANKKRTIKQNKTQLFAIILNDWVSKLTFAIHSSLNTKQQEKVLDIKLLHSREWLKRIFKQDQHEKECFIRLENKQKTLHAIAEDLWINYKKGNITTAREGLAKLQHSYDDVIKYLDEQKVL